MILKDMVPVLRTYLLEPPLPDDSRTQKVTQALCRMPAADPTQPSLPITLLCGSKFLRSDPLIRCWARLLGPQSQEKLNGRETNGAVRLGFTKVEKTVTMARSRGPSRRPACGH